MTEIVWGVSYHTNSHSPRAKKWYRVARFAYVDGGWFELYWHPTLRCENKAEIRAKAKALGVPLEPGTFTAMPSGPNKRGGEMEHNPR